MAAVRSTQTQPVLPAALMTTGAHAPPPHQGRHRMRHVSPITQPGHRLGVPNPNKGRRFPVDILKFEEIDAMKEGCNVGAMGLRNRAALDCLYGTGVRVGEFCALKVRDIDLETRAFRIYGTKTRNAD